ncbi:MAG: tRNA (adenosine(37)-N6)-threonylcarbamoyltransferase complex ATPase subunit type 1 TsaE [Chloroflexi bacterium]|nr:tRNA (adenosine(37)-N6)-threonylcarbamoyltransferase complex ATPase subunit type 1 TsaE [Chloroflexota bacterium]
MSVPRQYQLEFTCGSPQQTESLGRILGQLLRAGDLICLSGDLGAGKTVLSRGIGAGWGAATPLTSPTFNLVHEHTRAIDDARLFHIDCYRISGSGAADSIGFDDILDSSATALLEWPERIQTVLPSARMWIDILDSGGSQRHLVFEACGDRYVTLLARYQQLIGRKYDQADSRWATANVSAALTQNNKPSPCMCKGIC